jgi:hypothetical protein
MNRNFNMAVDEFLKQKTSKNKSADGKEEEVCDLQTGECYVIRSKDGIVERLNKKFITEDGRQLLED